MNSDNCCSVVDECAFFTLVMLGDDYVSPALALGASIVNSGSVVQRRYCMITNDVSQEARRRLSAYWQLLEVEYLNRQNLPQLLSQRMRDIYGSWISRSFTKWRCLEQAAKLNVTRYLFLDADTILLQNIDRLFLGDGQSVEQRGGQRGDDCCHIMTNFFPIFSTVSYHADRYHSSRLLERLRAFEANEREEELLWRCDVPRDELREVYFDATSTPFRTKRHFLLNSSMVFLRLFRRESELLFQFIEVSVRRARGWWYGRHFVDASLRAQLERVERSKTAVFANGWDEQVFAEALLAFPRYLRLSHLRTFCNVNAGFWDSSKIKMQPWSMTWWGSGKPWNDLAAVPKYADVYLWRYFYEMSRTIETRSSSDPPVAQSPRETHRQEVVR